MTKNPKTEKVLLLNDEIVHAGFSKTHVLTLRHLRHDDSWSPVITREVYQRANAVAVLPYDPVNDRIVLVEQFRPGTWLSGRDPWQFEPPAGMIQDGEDVETVARRETMEEAGCEIQDFEPICQYLVSPGCATELVHIFCGRVDSETIKMSFGGNADEHEDTRIHILDSSAAIASLSQGCFDYSLTIICLQWLALHRDDLRARWN